MPLCLESIKASLLKENRNHLKIPHSCLDRPLPDMVQRDGKKMSPSFLYLHFDSTSEFVLH